MKPSLRFKIFQRDEFTCRYCGKKSPEAILEIDHIVPVSGGGTDEIENLVTACYECNRGKGARMLTDVPEESDLHEKAIIIAEQERQLAEYNHWRTRQKTREDKQLDRLESEWTTAVDSDYYAANWNRATARTFIRKLGVEDVSDAIEIATERIGRGTTRGGAYKYFCGICWNKIKERTDAEQDH